MKKFLTIEHTDRRRQRLELCDSKERSEWQNTELKRFRGSFGVVCGLIFLLLLTGCSLLDSSLHVPSQTLPMEATGYCPCGKCCGWERPWWAPWKTVYSSGPSKGKLKKVGVTASGTQAKKGTIAADRKIYPFGTVMYIPGYGYGRVEDVGGAIQGPARVDLFFSTHQQALEWGRRRVSVTVWHQGR